MLQLLELLQLLLNLLLLNLDLEMLLEQEPLLHFRIAGWSSDNLFFVSRGRRLLSQHLLLFQQNALLFLQSTNQVVDLLFGRLLLRRKGRRSGWGFQLDFRPIQRIQYCVTGIIHFDIHVHIDDRRRTDGRRTGRHTVDRCSRTGGRQRGE